MQGNEADDIHSSLNAGTLSGMIDWRARADALKRTRCSVRVVPATARAESQSAEPSNAPANPAPLSCRRTPPLSATSLPQLHANRQFVNNMQHELTFAEDRSHSRVRFDDEQSLADERFVRACKSSAVNRNRHAERTA